MQIIILQKYKISKNNNTNPYVQLQFYSREEYSSYFSLFSLLLSLAIAGRAAVCNSHCMNIYEINCYVLLTVQPCIILQISPTRCTIQFYVFIYLFISLLYIFLASMCPLSGENCCIYATVVFVTLCGWHLA